MRISDWSSDVLFRSPSCRDRAAAPHRSALAKSQASTDDIRADRRTEMSPETHPAAPHYMPSFITAPGETDVLFNVAVAFIIALIVMIGNLYLRLHAIPEKIAHRGASKLQFQIVAVIALLALFTHNN